MMFSTNPFSQLLASSSSSTGHVVFPHPSINSLLEDEEKDGLYNNHHNHNQWNNNNNSPLTHENGKQQFNNTSEQQQQQQSNLVQGLGLENYCYDNHDLFGGPELTKKKSPKKDHHSKIHTSKGPRDRRVRLSIEVARKFFFLQDLLGFDKASKTLDWLFNKSKIPIVELIKRKTKSASSSSQLTDDRSEVVANFLESLEDEQQDQQGLIIKKRVAERSKRRKIVTRNSYKSFGSPHLVNQSRTEARARARERTKEKLSIKKLDKSNNNVNNNNNNAGDCCSNLTFQTSVWSSIESPNDYNDNTGNKSYLEENISMMYSSYQHNNPSPPNDESSSSFTANFPKFNGVLEPQGDRAMI